MEDREQIKRECLLAALQYFDPVLMELQLDQEEQASYTHKFFVMTKDAGAIIYRLSAGQYAVTEHIIPDGSAREQEMEGSFGLVIEGIPDDIPLPVDALCRSRLNHAVTELAAHAIAYRLNQTILIASYAEIESKFHGEGPKNIKAIFAAERDHAILFIDEAESLLSKRLTKVTQGSEQAINSMRSQMFICLQEFRGVVIFATNLVENYDKAFETRVRYLRFPLPDEQCRREIWRRHLVPQLPVAENVSLSICCNSSS